MTEQEIRETLSTIKEIESLDRYILGHLQTIEEEKKRISHVLKLQDNKIDEQNETEKQYETLKKELQQNEKSLHLLCENLQKAEKNREYVKTENQLKATENEVKKFSQEKEQIEEVIINQMEKLEALESLLNEQKDFIKGSQETIEELKVEINEKEKFEQKEIQNYEERIIKLYDQMPSNITNKHSSLRKELRFKDVACIFVSSHCPKCGFTLPKSKELSIQSFKSIESCSNCKRIFIPQSTV